MRFLLWSSIALATFAMLSAIRTHRNPHATPATRWGSRGTVILSLAILAGTLPGVLFPASTPIRISAAIVSVFLTLTTIVTLRHTRRATARQWREIRDAQAKMRDAAR